MQDPSSEVGLDCIKDVLSLRAIDHDVGRFFSQSTLVGKKYKYENVLRV